MSEENRILNENVKIFVNQRTSNTLSLSCSHFFLFFPINNFYFFKVDFFFNIFFNAWNKKPTHILTFPSLECIKSVNINDVK